MRPRRSVFSDGLRLPTVMNLSASWSRLTYKAWTTRCPVVRSALIGSPSALLDRLHLSHATQVLIRSGVWTAAFQGLAKLQAAILAIVAARLMPPSELGTFFGWLGALLLLIALVDFGSTTWVAREVAAGEPERSVLRQSLRVRLVLSPL